MQPRALAGVVTGALVSGVAAGATAAASARRRSTSPSSAPVQAATVLRPRADGASRTQLRDDVRRLESLLETGTAVTVEGRPVDRGPLAGGVTEAVTGTLRGVGAP